GSAALPRNGTRGELLRPAGRRAPPATRRRGSVRPSPSGTGGPPSRRNGPTRSWAKTFQEASSPLLIPPFRWGRQAAAGTNLRVGIGRHDLAAKHGRERKLVDDTLTLYTVPPSARPDCAPTTAPTELVS